MENLQVDTDNLYMKCAINIKRNKYVFAIETSRQEEFDEKLKCPCCLESVSLMSGEHKVPYFAHNSESSELSRHCLFRYASAYDEKEDCELELAGLDYWKLLTFSEHCFSEFIGSKCDDFGKLNGLVIDRTRVVLRAMSHESQSVKELLHPAMRNFTCTTLRGFLSKTGMTDKTILVMPDDSLKRYVIDSYIECLELYRKYVYSHQFYYFRNSGKEYLDSIWSKNYPRNFRDF